MAWLAWMLGLVQAASADLLPIEALVDHRFVTNGPVRIHTARMGSGPLVVLIHGFPDCWLTWREQMPALAQAHEVVAMDLRGYGSSDRPVEDAAYDMAVLVSDVEAVIRDSGRENAVVVGHDWGGAVAWSVAQMLPHRVARLGILNLPHPKGLMRELATNPAQHAASAYARRFQEPGAHTSLTPAALAGWVRDPDARTRYEEIFRHADFNAMLALYRRNYPREPYRVGDGPIARVSCPVLMIHGLKDTALLAPALNGTWDWVADELTLLTLPDAGHFVQQDEADRVTRALVTWLGSPGK